MRVAEDARYAIRRLRKNPAATIAAIATLAVSIGAAVATWSMLSAVLLHPFPIADSRRWVVPSVTTERPSGPIVQSTLVYPLYPLLRDMEIFERVVAHWSDGSVLPVRVGATPGSATVSFVTHDFFTELGIGVPVGRTLRSDDDRRGAPPVAILSYQYWQRVWFGDPSVIGQTILVSAKPVTIVGVAMPRFRGLSLAETPDLFLPLHVIGDLGSPLTNFFADAGHTSSPTSGLMILGRLRENETREMARAKLATVKSTNAGRPLVAPTELISLETIAIPALARTGVQRFGTLLAATTGLLLLIGCATVGILLLARSEARRTEFATCLALGASRGQLIRSVVTEGALLCAGGSLLAVPMTFVFFKALTAFQLPGSVRIESLELTVDGGVVVASVCSAVLAAIVVGLVGGSFSLTRDLMASIRTRGTTTAPFRRDTMRASLVTGQVAVAMALLAGTGLLARSLMAALALNADRNAERILTGNIQLDPHGYDLARATAYYDTLSARLRRHPLIESLGFMVADRAMTAGGVVTIDGAARKFPTAVAFTAVDLNYFDSTTIPLLAGRRFSQDDHASNKLVAVVSESFGRQLANGGSPIGHRVTTLAGRTPGQVPPELEIVGVVGDVVTNIAALEPLVLYVPLAQTAVRNNRTLVLRAKSDVSTVRREVAAILRSIDPAVSMQALTLRERIMSQLSAQQFGVTVLGSLAGVAVLLTLLGAYVLAETMSARRARELGIRAALGARSGQLARLVITDTARQIALGIAIGFALIWAGSGSIRAFLFGVRPYDSITLVMVTAAIGVIAVAVTMKPVLRAARVDLAAILRDE